MDKRRILLTGANGMVGKNFLEHPDSKFFEILTPSKSELNLLSYHEIFLYLLDKKPDLIIHAAGKVAGIEANLRDPVGYFIENLDMGRNIVLAAFNSSTYKLINFGSSCMYPRNINYPLTENLILTGELEPTNEGYAIAKIATAKLCEYISKQNLSYKYKTIIPCNLFGRHDKFDPNYSHMLPACIHKIHQAKILNQRNVEIWGDGKARREFMFAGDLADFLIKLIDNFESAPEYLNVGLGYDYSIDEYYEAVAKVVGFDGGFFYNKDKPSGMQRKVVDVTSLHNWGWKSKTPLINGIEKAYNFYLKGLS
jgi:GDP-L-fucose synthase